MPELKADVGKQPPRTGKGDEAMDIAFLSTEKMSLLSLSLCTEALRVANRVLGRAAFRWHVLSEAGFPVTTSGGMKLTPDGPIDPAQTFDIVIVLASYDPEAACSAPVLAWLRRMDRTGAMLGCVDTGAHLLGRAGLLRGAPVALHHEAVAPFEERWASASSLDRAYIVEDRRLSAGGGIDTLDMMLALIGRRAGEVCADRVATILRYERHESAGDWSIGLLGVGAMSPALRRCIDLMYRHIEEPLAIDALCRQLGQADWKLRQLFRRHLKTTPGRYYMKLRLERARSLLRWSDLTVSDIATACGFADGSSFAHAYTRIYERAPSAERSDAARDGFPLAAGAP